ncbi:hypothetical protein F5Y03DRAFT_388951 [Xylaria venustula]|nr:hypothetical protein F5Y03DRAFT_388951 [Xylaria venustula]
MESSPYKPDNEERDNYFHGFSGSPQLILQHLKHYMAIDDADTIGKWSKDLSIDIITALGQCKWSYFFPIRTCLKDDAHRQHGAASTILLVAVEPASLQWEDGIKIALACRDIIRKFKIFDVEVEIMEGRYTQQAASTLLFDYDHTYDETKSAILPLLSYTGWPIAYLENVPGEGTVGLHLKLGADDSTVYGLTCRHVVYNTRAAHESYKPSAENRQYHIQANADRFFRILSNVESTIQDGKEGLKTLQSRIKENIPPPSEEDREHLTSQQKDLAWNNSVVKILEQMVDRKDRKIGHLAFLPSFALSSRRPGYLKDWALVELDLKNFSSSPNNIVVLGPHENKSFKAYKRGEMRLKLNPKHRVNCKSYAVAKRGARTGLTFGKTSGIEAVTRAPGEGLAGDVYTWEMLIVPEDGAQYFSQKGDSGSAVFNVAGEVVAIVTASNGVANNGETSWRGVPDEGSSNPRRLRKFGQDITGQDIEETPSSERVKLPEGIAITFAAPIKWVLDDIQDFTGLNPRLA